MPKISEGLPILQNTIDKTLRHQDYPEVVKIAEEFTMYATGIGIETKLKRFNGGETEELWNQRKILTICNVADIFNSCVKPFNKASRTPASVTMSWEGKDSKYNSENKKVILKAAKNFWGKQSVKTYLTRRVANIDSQDPNSFLVVEFKETVDPKKPETKNKKPKAYPFEVNSSEAINFIYQNNELQWLIVLNDIVMIGPEGENVIGEKYYMYLDNHNITATQIHTQTIKTYIKNVSPTILTDVQDFDSMVPNVNYLYSTSEEGEENKRYYQINVYQTMFGFVPAIRFGTETDPSTRNRTCIPLVNPAKSYFEDSIQTMSEFSITKRLHAFPQKYQYLPKCDAEGCFAGQTRDLKTCKKCNGSGTIAHSSSQDIIGIKMPDELKDIVNLEFMSAYKGPPIDLLKFQKEFGFEDIRRYSQSAIFSNDIGRKRVRSATESEIDAEAVNDTVKPFGDNLSDLYEFIYKCIAVLNDLDEGFEYTHTYPDDFQLQTITEILDDLKKANDNGAPSHIKKSLTRKLMHKLYIDQPREIQKQDIKDKYYPFAGKTETEIQFVLASPGFTTKAIKVLYSHFDLIFSDLEYEFGVKNLDFYELDEQLQRAAIKTKVDELIKQIDLEGAADSSTNFGASGSDIVIPTDVEAEAKARLRGSVGGVQGILAIQASVAQQTTDYEAGIATLEEIYGLTVDQAKKILGNPKIVAPAGPTA